MNWEAIGAIGEIVGAIGVIITLVYLAVQIRSSARATEAQVHASLSSEMESLAVALAQDDALADAMTLAMRDGDLTDAQRTKLGWWFGGFMRVCESHILQRELGATSIEIEKPIANILSRYAQSNFFHSIMTRMVENRTATDKFLGWLECEVLNREL